MKVCAAILTGGKNSRMNGKTKSLLDICNRSIIDMQIEILDDIFDKTIICGKGIKNKANYTVIEDEYQDIGPISGIYNAIKNSDTDYTFVFSSDLPFLNKNMIADMIKLLDITKPEVLIPSHSNGLEPLHAIYHKSLAPKIEKQISEKNYKIRECFLNADTHKFIVNKNYNPEKSFFNVNTPQDLEKAILLCKTN